MFVEGIPEDIPALFPLHCHPGILVLDDFMRNCSEYQHILHLFTKVSHHCNVTCLYLTQNLFPLGKFSRSISLNTHYLIVFNNPRDTLGVRTLAQQAFAGHVPYVWESIQDAHSSLTVISCFIYIHEHRSPCDYPATSYLNHNLTLWFTSTRKRIKQTALWLLTLVSNMPVCKWGRSVKSRIANQRGGTMVLRSGTITQTKRVRGKQATGKETAWPSGQRDGLAIRRSWVRVLLWPLAGFVLGRPEFKFSATLVNSQLVVSCQLGYR